MLKSTLKNIQKFEAYLRRDVAQWGEGEIKMRDAINQCDVQLEGKAKHGGRRRKFSNSKNQSLGLEQNGDNFFSNGRYNQPLKLPPAFLPSFLFSASLPLRCFSYRALGFSLSLSLAPSFCILFVCISMANCRSRSWGAMF